MRDKALFGNRDFILLWAGQAVSQLGTCLYDLAIMWYILQKTGSSLAMGISVLCYTLPTVIIGPVAGVFADRLDKKKIIIITDFINGVIMLALSYFLAKDSITVNTLYGAMALAACVSAIFSPAIGSSLPLIVGNEHLTKANSLAQFTSRLISILGPAAAGIMIAALDMWVLFFINGISFLIASAAEVFVYIPKVNTGGETDSFFVQFKEGLSCVWNNKAVLYLVISGGIIINFFLAPLSIYAAVISKNLNRGAAGLGMIESFVAVGALLGSLMILCGLFKNKYRMAIIGLSMEGVALIGYGVFAHNYYMILGFAGIIGLGVAMASVGISTLYQTLIPKEAMGRVLSIGSTLCTISIPLGALAGSAAIGYYSMKLVLVISGIIVSIAGLSLVGILKSERSKEGQTEYIEACEEAPL